MVGFGDGEWRHKDVWKHTKQVVRQAVPRLEVRWASLFHDIGKVKTRCISPGRQGALLRSRRGRHAHVRQARSAPPASSRPSRRCGRRCASSSSTTSAPTSTTRAGPTAPCAASRASSARTSTICSASPEPTSRRSARRRSARACSQIQELEDRITQLAARGREAAAAPVRRRRSRHEDVRASRRRVSSARSRRSSKPRSRAARSRRASRARTTSS